ncbi:MAG: cytochrome c [Nitrospirota bacterium]
MRRSIIAIIIGTVLFNMIIYIPGLTAGSEVEKGRRLYEEKRCGLCHAIGGKGGKMGLDLSEVGSKRDAEWLIKFFKDPKGTMEGAKMLSVKGTDEEISALADYMLSLKK